MGQIRKVLKTKKKKKKYIWIYLTDNKINELSFQWKKKYVEILHPKWPMANRVLYTKINDIKR